MSSQPTLSMIEPGVRGKIIVNTTHFLVVERS